MPAIQMVITDNGDGSSGIHWVTDPAVIDKMEELADEGHEAFASGGGLQVQTLEFPEGFDIDAFIKTNHLSITTLGDMEGYDY